MLSQRVAQRTQEIGIRVALGARRDDVLKLIIGEGLRLTLIGIAIGIAGSLALARFLSSMLYGVTPTVPLTVAAGLRRGGLPELSDRERVVRQSYL